MDTQDIVQRLKNEGRDEGRREGRHEALQTTSCRSVRRSLDPFRAKTPEVIDMNVFLVGTGAP
jgi:hypothetical protein